MTEKKQSPAFRILMLLYLNTQKYNENRNLPREERDPNVSFWVYPLDIAEELNVDHGSVRKALAGLRTLGIVRRHSDGMWGFDGGSTFDFLNKSSGEFTQATLKEGLGVSQPTASRKMSLLAELGLIEISRAESVPVTGGRRLWFKRA